MGRNNHAHQRWHRSNPAGVPSVWPSRSMSSGPFTPLSDCRHGARDTDHRDSLAGSSPGGDRTNADPPAQSTDGSRCLCRWDRARGGGARWRVPWKRAPAAMIQDGTRCDNRPGSGRGSRNRPHGECGRIRRPPRQTLVIPGTLRGVLHAGRRAMRSAEETGGTSRPPGMLVSAGRSRGLPLDTMVISTSTASSPIPATLRIGIGMPGTSSRGEAVDA